MIEYLLEMNLMGHLTLSHGDLSLYIQQDQEIERFLSQPTEDDRVEVEKGWATKVFLTDEYLGVMEDEKIYRMTDRELLESHDRDWYSHHHLSEVQHA